MFSLWQYSFFFSGIGTYLAALNLEYWNSQRNQQLTGTLDYWISSQCLIQFLWYQILPRLLGAVALFPTFTLKIGTLHWNIKGVSGMVKAKTTDAGGFPGKESCQCQCRRLGFGPWVGKIPWRRNWQPMPVLFSYLGNSWTEQTCGIQSLGLQKNQPRLVLKQQRHSVEYSDYTSCISTQCSQPLDSISLVMVIDVMRVF